jgi:hypothetical protein
MTLVFETTEEVMLKRVMERAPASGRVDDNAEVLKERFSASVDWAVGGDADHTMQARTARRRCRSSLTSKAWSSNGGKSFRRSVPLVRLDKSVTERIHFQAAEREPDGSGGGGEAIVADIYALALTIPHRSTAPARFTKWIVMPQL